MTRVLLVDPNGRFRQTLAPLIRTGGRVVEVAAEHHQALKAVEWTPYDAVVLDVPVENPLAWGFLVEFCSKVGVRYGPKLLCISEAHPGEDLRLKIQTLGARWAGFVGEDFRSVLEELHLILADARVSGLHIAIYHKTLPRQGSYCVPGEQVVAATMEPDTLGIEIPVTPAGLVQLDYLARAYFSQNARQISDGIRYDSLKQSSLEKNITARLPHAHFYLRPTFFRRSERGWDGDFSLVQVGNVIHEGQHLPRVNESQGR